MVTAREELVIPCVSPSVSLFNGKKEGSEASTQPASRSSLPPHHSLEGIILPLALNIDVEAFK